MATLKRQNANGEWEIIQLTGEDVNQIKDRLEDIEKKITDGTIGENIPPIEVHEHVNKELLDRLSLDSNGKLLYDGVLVDEEVIVHEHLNKDILDKITVSSNGELLYNGVPINKETVVHEHTNKSILDKLTVNGNGELLYNGVLINRETEVHEHINKAILDKISQDSEGNLLYNGEKIKSDDSSILVQDTVPTGIEEGRIWIDTSENTYQGIDVNGINSTLNQLSSDNTTNKTDIANLKNHSTNSKSITSVDGIHGIRFFEDKLSIKVNGTWVQFELGGSNSNVDTGALELAIQSLNNDNVKNKQDITNLKNFISTDITTIEGKHGIRYYEDKLSIKVDGEWIEFVSSGGNTGGEDEGTGEGSAIEGSGLALDGVARFTVTPANNKNILYWTDPEKDINLDGVVVATWEGTKVLRKQGSFPIDENDGVLVVNSRVHNEYAREGYVDSGLDNGVEYYYSIFPYTNYGTYSEKKNAKGKPIAQKIYGIRIAKDNSNPIDRVSYIRDAEGFTPISSSSSGVFDWGSWQEIFNSWEIKPCLLKNGNVNYYLNPNDYTKKADGTTADITSGNDGDVMVEFGKTLWWKFTDEGILSYTVEISDMAFEGAVKHAFEIEEGYNLIHYYQFMLLQILFLIFYKSTNFATFSYHYAYPVGQTNKLGLFYGKQHANGCKAFGIDDIFVSGCHINGIKQDVNGDVLIKKTNLGDLNYTNAEKIEITYTGKPSAKNGYARTVQATNDTGLLGKDLDASSSTYYFTQSIYNPNYYAQYNGGSIGVAFNVSESHSSGTRLAYNRNGRIYIGVYKGVILGSIGNLRSLSIAYKNYRLIDALSYAVANNTYVI